jgi:hypothetical protein
MKTTILIIALFASFSTMADEAVMMSNGTMCFRQPSGFIYGCAGGEKTRERQVIREQKNWGQTYQIERGYGYDSKGHRFEVPNNQSYQYPER